MHPRAMFPVILDVEKLSKGVCKNGHPTKFWGRDGDHEERFKPERPLTQCSSFDRFNMDADDMGSGT